MSIESAKSLLQSGFGIWLASFAGVAVAVVVCVTWLDRPIALLAYEWLGRHRAVQHFAETPGFFGSLVVLAFAVLLLRWILARRFGTMDIVATLCIITLAIGKPLKGWLKFIFGWTLRHRRNPLDIFAEPQGALRGKCRSLVVNFWEHRMRCGLMRLSSHLPGLDVSAAIDCVRG